MHMLWNKCLLMRAGEGDISAHLLLINHQTRCFFSTMLLTFPKKMPGVSLYYTPSPHVSFRKNPPSFLILELPVLMCWEQLECHRRVNPRAPLPSATHRATLTPHEPRLPRMANVAWQTLIIHVERHGAHAHACQQASHTPILIQERTKEKQLAIFRGSLQQGCCCFFMSRTDSSYARRHSSGSTLAWKNPRRSRAWSESRWCFHRQFMVGKKMRFQISHILRKIPFVGRQRVEKHPETGGGASDWDANAGESLWTPIWVFLSLLVFIILFDKRPDPRRTSVGHLFNC